MTNNNDDNIFAASIGAIISNVASINGLDIVQSLLLALVGGGVSMLGKDLYNKFKKLIK